MRTHIIFALLITIFFSHIIQLYAAEPDQFEKHKIAKIVVSVVNGSREEGEAIKSRLKTREGDLFIHSNFDADLKALAHDFDRINPHIELINDNVFIRLELWPKPIIRVIRWHGNQKICTRDLQAELGINFGVVFDRDVFNKAFCKVQEYYTKKGYFEAQLNYRVAREEIGNQVDIDIYVTEGRAGWIKEIIFENFTCEEEAGLRKIMATQEYSFLTSWITDTGVYQEEAMQHDQLVVLNYLQNEGFADARVQIDVQEIPNCHRIVLLIRATRGPVYTFGCIRVTGNTIFDECDIRKRFIIHQGRPYSPEQLRETIDLITRLYGRFGYIDACVDASVRRQEGCCVYDIDLTIVEGIQYRIGLIKVFGNCSTQTSVILHETLLIPGEVFNVEKLRRTEDRLMNVGFFRSVNVYAIQSSEACELGDNYRDVHIEVEETSTAHVGASLGYSTAGGIVGSVNLTERNFSYKGLLNRNRSLRGGGEFAHIEAQMGSKSRSYALSWAKPYFRDTKWTVGFDIDKASNRYYSKDYNIETVGLLVHGSYPLNAFMKFSCHYRIKYTDVDVTHTEKKAVLEDSIEEGLNPKVVQHETKSVIDNDGIISAVGAAWIYDSTNSIIKPTEGFKSRVDTELSGVGGDYFFWSIAYLNNYYFQLPFDKKGIWRVRADFRFLQPFNGTKGDHLPMDERYFLGGPSSVRGYRDYHQGPHTRVARIPIGGISMQLFSLEYTRPIISHLDGFVFTDCGGLSLHPWQFGPLQSSAGFGFKVFVSEPGPAITFGFGFPFNPKRHSEVRRFFLNLGGAF